MEEQQIINGAFYGGESNTLLAALETKNINEFEKEYQRLILKDFAQKSDLRSIFAKNIFTLVCIYLIVVGVFLWLSGMTFKDFKLSDNVLITLLTTTSANIISLFVFVVKYLFPEDKK